MNRTHLLRRAGLVAVVGLSLPVFAQSGAPTPPAAPAAATAPAAPTTAAAPAVEKKYKVEAVVLDDPYLSIIVDTEGTVPSAEDVKVHVSSGHVEVTNVASYADSELEFATIMLVDKSGSMAQTYKDVRQAATAYVDGMAARDQIILAQFGDAVEGLDAPWQGASAKESLKATIKGWDVYGKQTHLTDALNGAVDRALKEQTDGRLSTVLLLSDGYDNGSSKAASMDRARGFAVDRGIRINAVGFQPGRGAGQGAETSGTQGLKLLASDTRGQYSFASSSADIQTAFKRIQDHYHNLVVIRARSEALSAEQHAVEVTIGSGDGATTASYTLELKDKFIGENIASNDTWAYWTGGAILLVALAVAGNTWFRRQKAIEAAEQERYRREVEDRIAEAAAIARQKPGFLLQTADGYIPLFGPEEFGRLILGSDASRVQIHLADATVSGAHAELSRRPDDPEGLYVRDLGSSNGTYHQRIDIRGLAEIRATHHEGLQFGLVATIIAPAEV